MSYDDEYGTQSGDSHAGRSARRSDRGATGPKRATAGTATAILMLAAILGFSGGAIAGNSGGDDPPTDPSANTQAPDDADDDPDNSDGEDTASPDPEASETELTLTSPAADAEVPNGTPDADAGRFEFAGATDPPVGSILITIERSTDDGKTWETAGSSPLTTTTDGDGEYSTTFWSGRNGDNHFRAFAEDDEGNRMESNVIVVTIVPAEGDDDGDE